VFSGRRHRAGAAEDTVLFGMLCFRLPSVLLFTPQDASHIKKDNGTCSELPNMQVWVRAYFTIIKNSV